MSSNIEHSNLPKDKLSLPAIIESLEKRILTLHEKNIELEEQVKASNKLLLKQYENIEALRMQLVKIKDPFCSKCRESLQIKNQNQ